ncbi:glycosyltransferase family 2 protein [bacterium]|nr:glycosyltransferase family 2 protein [bacterium]
MKKISIVTACYNEEENVIELINRVRKIMESLSSKYDYEHIFIDNASEDKTVDLLKSEANLDRRIKIIVNSRNFGHVRSPSYALLQAEGDVVISLVADLQDPPEMITDFLEKWEDGNDIVIAVKAKTEETGFMSIVRSIYYRVLHKLSEVRTFKNFTGFGLFDKKVILALRQMSDPYPFFRGMLAEVGYKVYELPYNQPGRVRGITKNNFYSLYDMGVLGIISNSKIPLRLAIFIGAISATLSFLVGLVYLVLKLIYWNEMSIGIAPLMIIVSFMLSILLFFLGLIGEYVGAIYTQVLNRPLVFVKERVNFDI